MLSENIRRNIPKTSKHYITCLSIYIQILTHLKISIVYYYKNKNYDLNKRYVSLCIENDSTETAIYMSAIYPHFDNTPQKMG